MHLVNIYYLLLSDSLFKKCWRNKLMETQSWPSKFLLFVGVKRQAENPVAGGKCSDRLAGRVWKDRRWDRNSEQDKRVGEASCRRCYLQVHCIVSWTHGLGGELERKARSVTCGRELGMFKGAQGTRGATHGSSWIYEVMQLRSGLWSTELRVPAYKYHSWEVPFLALFPGASG